MGRRRLLGGVRYFFVVAQDQDMAYSKPQKSISYWASALNAPIARISDTAYCSELSLSQ